VKEAIYYELRMSVLEGSAWHSPVDLPIHPVTRLPIAGETLKFYLQITLWLGEEADCTQSTVRDLVMDEFKGLVTANNSLKLKKMMVIECSSMNTLTKFR
jgi:hypothetical protein